MIEKIKKHWWKIIIISIPVIVVQIILNSRLMMLNLPTGDYIDSLMSPNGEYTINSYRYSGGATMDWSLRVEVVNNKTNKKTNIYWKYHKKDAEMKWIDDETVEINKIKLNIYKDFYKNYEYE